MHNIVKRPHAFDGASAFFQKGLGVGAGCQQNQQKQTSHTPHTHSEVREFITSHPSFFVMLPTV
jgi:hypothetical protein